MVQFSKIKLDEIHEISSHHNLHNISNQPPLHISKQARIHIDHTKVVNLILDSKYLRVHSRKNADIVEFDILFDDNIASTDKIYKINSVLFVLDNETAYLLIGSELGLDMEQNFEFTHQEYGFVELNIDGDGNRIFN